MKFYKITIASVAVFVLIVGGYFYFSGNDSSQDSPQPMLGLTNFNVLETNERKMPLGQREYKSSQFGFSLFYPDGMAVKEFGEGGGAGTITFEDAVNARGFQIFVVPHNGTQVSEERFLKDTPSGVRKESTDIFIDGATASAFYSTHAFLGETREVWFIHGGYLFEVTTPRSGEFLLTEILPTWQFTR